MRICSLCGDVVLYCSCQRDDPAVATPIGDDVPDEPLADSE